jgi:hypothetical protein
MNASNPVYLSKSSGGYSALCTMTQGDPNPVPGPQAYFRDKFEHPDREPDYQAIPRTYTVRFHVRGPTPSAGSAPLACTYECLAYVETMVAGVPSQRIMNVIYGSAITVTAETVNVRLKDVTNASFIPDGVNEYPFSPQAGANKGQQQYGVFVHVVPGERPNYLLPPQLKGVTDVVGGEPSVQSGVVTVGGGTSARWPVPQDAGVIGVEVVAVNANAPNTPANCLATAAAASVDAKQWNPQIDVGLKLLPANTTYVEVQNFGTSEEPVAVTLTWIIEG